MVSHTTRHTTLRIIRAYKVKKRKGERGPLSQGVQARRKALRIPHIHGMAVRKEVRKKRPRGVHVKPPGPPRVCFSLDHAAPLVAPRELLGEERILLYSAHTTPHATLRLNKNGEALRQRK
jgi:hypothetical protein